MKKIALAFFSFSMMAGTIAQNVFTYGKHSVSKEEFVRAFNKNPVASGDRKQALKEYLDLYINFKLKVQAAYDEGLDKDPTQQYELENFRRQVADNIINEQANLKELVREAFNRSKKEIKVSQVFVEVPTGGDTLEAYKIIHTAYSAIKSGKDFTTAAKEYSNDASTKETGGELGYITAFTLPYDLENIIYNLAPNQYSAPVKTKLGYHIFKNTGERKSAGSRKVAQIMIAFPQSGNAEDKSKAQRKADSIYNLLVKGAKFETLVESSSNDLSSNFKKGELPEFTTGTYSADFENVAFSLNKPGEISKPFHTANGFHILKLLETKPAPDNIEDATAFANMQEKVLRDNRMEQAKKNLLKKILTNIKYKPGVYKEQDLHTFTDSAVINKTSQLNGINDNTVLFSFAKQNIRASEWVKYVSSIKSASEDFNSSIDYKQMMSNYINSMAFEYYRTHLEDYNADYLKQINEFKEANLLFAIMEKNVWGSANADTTGLQEYYLAHKTKYMWPASADALIITSANETVSEAIQKQLKDSVRNWRYVTSKYQGDVVADSGRYELSQLPVVDRTNFTNFLFTAPVKNETDGSYTFNYIFNMYNEPSQRSFDDARGMVISDYQQVLEDKWIAQLRKKYPVVVNQPVFQSIK